jgi:predicted GIY-YIG superfamily endonuclease
MARSLKDIYKAFGLRYDLREARRYLREAGLGEIQDRKEINQTLRDVYNYIWEDMKDVYLYKITGESRAEYIDTKGKKRLSKPKPIDMTFQSRTKYNIKKANIVGVKDFELTHEMVSNKLPFVYWTDAEDYLGNEDIVNDWMKKGDNPTQYMVNTVLKVSRRKLPSTKKSLKDVPLYNATINLPYKEFNGFRDSGNMMCVPETLLHHLQLNGRNKKQNLETIIELLNNQDTDREDLDEEDAIYEAEEGEVEPATLEDETQGYTACDIIRVLEHFRCRGRLLDIHQKEFMTSEYNRREDFDKKLLVFVGIVYNHHLYYCDDSKFIKSISEKMKAQKNQSRVVDQVYEKSLKKDTRDYDVIESHDLMEYYKSTYTRDKTIRLVKTENGRITRIDYDEKVVCANPEKTIMQKMLGDKFKNENTTMLGELEFKEFFPNHKKSNFTKDVQDKLSKHGNIVKSFAMPDPALWQHEYDVNKCRADCWMNNALGDWEVFGFESQIRDYSGTIRKGWYYIVPFNLRDLEFFMRGSSWYSGDFVKYGLKEGYNCTIEYELIASSTIKADHFKPFVKMLIRKYPQLDEKGKPIYKKIIVSAVGYRGRTNIKEKKGYIEADYEQAVSAFWDNNDEKIGFLYDKNIDKKIWRTMKGRLCNVGEINIGDETQYIVEYTDYKTLYENDLPIYNKILENEYLKIYHLVKSLDGRVIKIKTDAVIVEGKHNKIPLSKEIGGIKYSRVKAEVKSISEERINYDFHVDTSLEWNVIKEKEDWSVDLPSGSYLVTALAGFGKSVLTKKQPEYFREDTLRLGFTNVACENLSSDNQVCHTLNSYFGIDFNTGKGSEKKLKNLREIKCIILTEAFMTPVYLMGYLSMIKEQFPEIKFICEGDPEQIRPVKEEHINWLEKDLFHKLCDGNLVKLIYNKRNDEESNYDKILTGLRLDDEKYGTRAPQIMNICKTNKMRVSINHEMMDRSGYFISKSRENPKSQDVWITEATPIMCIKNDKDLGLKNGKMCEVSCIDKTSHMVIIKNGYSLLRIRASDFAKHFVVAYAVTNHKVQGITIRVHYNIYEWNQMSRREQYTAYSRTADGNLVKIIETYATLSSSSATLDKLWEDLRTFFRENYCIYKWSSSECNHIYVGHTNDFNKRKAEHLKACKEGKQNKLYEYMREYGGWTMTLVESFYAPNREEAEKVEQKWIDALGATLNMCAATKSL